MKINELPHNMDVERTILGSLLDDVNYDLCRQSLDYLCVDDFYSLSHRILFDAIKTKAEAKQPVDIITISDELSRLGKLDQSGGFAYMAELVKGLISKANMMAHVKVIKSSAKMREILQMANQIIDQHQNNTPSELMGFVESKMTEIGDDDNGKDATHISEFGPNWLDCFDAKSKSGGSISGLETGIHELDERLSGFDLEGLIVLAGRPSMGKTLLAQTIMSDVSGRQGKTSLFFSMEMSDKQVYERFVSKESAVCPKKIRSAQNFTDEDWGRLNTGVKAVNDSKIFVHTDSKLTYQQIRARVRRQTRKHGGLGLIVIDYLGLMKPPKADRHDIAIGEITASLKALAKEIQVPILLLVQGKRAGIDAKRPTMNDLKDSSSIEADADVVLFVHRQEILDPETELKGVTELIIAKDRHNDGNGTVYLSKVSGGFNSIDRQTVAEMCHKEETKNKPKARGYAKNNLINKE